VPFEHKEFIYTVHIGDAYNVDGGGLEKRILPSNDSLSLLGPNVPMNMIVPNVHSNMGLKVIAPFIPVVSSSWPACPHQ